MNSHPDLTWLHTGPLRGAFLTLGSEFMQYGAIARSNASALQALIPVPECQTALVEIQQIGQAILDQAQVLFHGSHEGDGLLMVRVRADRAQHIPIMGQARTPAFNWAWEQPLDTVLATTAAEFHHSGERVQSLLQLLEALWPCERYATPKVSEGDGTWRLLWQAAIQPIEKETERFLLLIDNELVGILLPRVRRAISSDRAIE